jgi:N-acetylmuramoyl-L-alanine amidase
MAPAAAPLQPSSPPPPTVVIDDAHGGSESGALLNPAIPEKDITLVFARRLRQELGARAVPALVIREGDATMSADQRAGAVNASNPSLYICLHASSFGKGIRVYTAMETVAGENRGPFVNWENAQAAARSRSLWASQQISVAIQKAGFSVRNLTAPLRPLNNIIVPGIAIEIAPTDGSVLQLASSDYQQLVCAALANAIAGVVPSLRSKSAGH